MENPKFESLLKKHSAMLTKTSRELAMNFEVPSRDIISMACVEMGISENTWRALQSYIIAKEQAV